MKKLSLGVIAFLALVATLAADVRLPQAARAMSLVAFRQSRPAGKQLPAGFVLPSSDVDLTISSLVAADLDADGDLDIVATAPSGSVGIVVWVNDGDGRLTRKRPNPPKTLGAEPPAPSVDRQTSSAIALTQTGGPALPANCGTAWITLDPKRCHTLQSAPGSSPVPSTLRPRAPPVLA